VCLIGKEARVDQPRGGLPRFQTRRGLSRIVLNTTSGRFLRRALTAFLATSAQRLVSGYQGILQFT
jgi:hypothetical protein